MDREKLKSAVEKGQIEWQRHALERMIERGISREDVKKILLTGDIIEEYPDDKPYPGVLISGDLKTEHFHVVVAFDQESEWCFVITVYRPDLDHFEADYKTRKRR